MPFAIASGATRVTVPPSRRLARGVPSAYMESVPPFSRSDRPSPAVDRTGANTRAGGDATSPHETVWDELSAVYDRQLWLERRAVGEALDLAQPGPDTTVLDAGTGTGAVLGALATRPNRPEIAVGIDASAGMLASVPHLPEGWRLRRADLEALPLDDASFDLALAVYVLHVLAPSTRAAALRELRRVLRPGGRLVTVTPVVPRRALSRPFWLAMAGLARAAPRRFCGLRPLDPRAELREAGFRLERARTVHTGYYSLCVAARSPGLP